MKEIDKEEHIVLSVLLLIITLVCLGVSWWSMTEGYESLAGSKVLSAAIATALVIMMFALNYSLRRGLQNGMPVARTGLILFMYLVVVLASFSGMFNKFYSNFMHSELVNEELTYKIKALSSLQNAAQEVLTDQRAETIRGEVTRLVESLKLQIQNPAEPGLGPRAEATLKEIEKMLGVRLERLPPKNKSAEELKRAANAYEDYILNKVLQGSDAMLKLNSAERRNYAEQVPKILGPAINDLIKIQTELQAGSTETTQATAISIIGDSVRKYNEVALKVNSLQKEKEFEYDEHFRVENDNIGKISHTYASAGNHLNHWGVWVAAALAFGIDLIVPIFVFVLTPKGRRASYSGGGRGAKEL